MYLTINGRNPTSSVPPDNTPVMKENLFVVIDSLQETKVLLQRCNKSLQNKGE